MSTPPKRKGESNQDLRAHLRHFFLSGKWTGISLFFAALIGFGALTEVRSGPLLAAIVSLGAYGVLAYLLPNRIKQRMTEEGLMVPLADAPTDPRVELLVEGHQHLSVLASTQDKVPLATQDSLVQLHTLGTNIVNAVAQDPAKLTPVLRFFTYYLPATADLATDRVVLAAHAGDARLTEIDQTLARLIEAFKGFEQSVMSPDLQSVDLDMELLEDALNEDFENLKR